MTTDIASRNLRGNLLAVVTDESSGCWQMPKLKPHSNGYQRFSLDGQRDYAHRWFYRLFKGEIPPGLQLDHLCRNRACVNPAHLEAVTPRVNVLRGESAAARNHAKTSCVRGHPFDEQNTYWRRDRPGARQCKRCSAVKMSAAA